jgi:glycosyltransferase involved in cell wall biosynthesis
LLGELDSDVPWTDKAAEVCYVGGMSRIRGIEQLVQAMGMAQSGVRLNLCGRISEHAVEQACMAMPGWQAVNKRGFVDRVGVREVLGRSIAGLVTFHSLPNHIHAQPNKIFEYMSAGVPVIASDFPLWREVVLGNQCGLCVDPMDPAAIARAIDYLVQHPDQARQMGENGRRAVLERYNWSIEEAKLINFYENILRA